MKKIPVVIFLLVVALFLFSCSKLSSDLSRSEAKNQLEKVDVGEITALFSNNIRVEIIHNKYNPYNKIEEEFENQDTMAAVIKLQENGYVTYRIDPEKTGWHEYHYLRVWPTEKLKPFMKGNYAIVVGKYNVSAITGITKIPGDVDARGVMFTAIPTPTLGSAYPLENQQAVNKIAIFRKYDSGWRVERVAQE